jgi:hypothetical protein
MIHAVLVYLGRQISIILIPLCSNYGTSIDVKNSLTDLSMKVTKPILRL